VGVCAKFGRDWSSELCVKEGHRDTHRYIQSLLYITSKPGLRLILRKCLFLSQSDPLNLI